MKIHQLPEFADLSACRVELRSLCGGHERALERYCSRTTMGFSHKSDKPKMSIASTSTCVLSLKRTGRWSENEVWEETTQPLVRRLLKTKWKSSGLVLDNAFTVAFVLEAVTALDQERTNSRTKKAEEILQKNISRGNVCRSTATHRRHI